jgi:multiple inositol-polyphosphate phosphatase/2,3-bisphosphoglycerate 3-phosphatase
VDALNGNGTVRIDDDFDEALTPTGREELLLLARRFRGRFAEFFNERPVFNPKDYQFRHVKSSAAQASARSFSRGIFSTASTADQVQLTEAPIGDRLVHFNHNCSLWKDVVDESEASERESNLFRQSPIYLKTLADVTARLGFQYNMSIEDMQIMYDICRYQKAWNLEVPSPWCSAFSIENLKVRLIFKI